jgi:hypothetical protein
MTVSFGGWSWVVWLGKAKWWAVAIVVTASVMVGVGPATAAKKTEASATWKIVKGANVAAGQVGLEGVSCATSTACEAAGYDNDAPFVEQLIGSTWTVTPIPDPTYGGRLLGVSCADPSDCMAVGYAAEPDQGLTSVSTPLAEWWNGSTWSITPAVNFNSEFNAVSCTTGTVAADCVAVGYIQNGPSQPGGSLIETWNGSSWSVSVGPQNEIPGYLLSVSCPVQGQCMAVGNGGNQNLAVQLSGGSWSTMDTPNASGSYVNNLLSVSCASASSCTNDWWASYKTLANNVMRSLNWDGESWSTGRAFVNKGTYSQLTAIDCPTTTSCVVVGSKGGGPVRTLVEGWNGAGWSVERSASTTTQSALLSVSCVSSTFCVSVGEDGALGEFKWPLIESGPA